MIRTEGNPIMVSRAPDVSFDLICKMRGDLKVGDVVFHQGRFFKVTKTNVHVGHGAVIYAAGFRKDGNKAEWNFNGFSGANCFIVAS